MHEYKEGQVVQCTDLDSAWCGALLIVDELKSYGVRAYMLVPHKGLAYVNLHWDQIAYIGESLVAEGSV